MSHFTGLVVLSVKQKQLTAAREFASQAFFWKSLFGKRWSPREATCNSVKRSPLGRIAKNMAACSLVGHNPNNGLLTINCLGQSFFFSFFLFSSDV